MINLFKFTVVLIYLFACNAIAAIAVQDDDGRWVMLHKPATRVISLAPHITELIFSVGGGNQLVGVINFSDFPQEAKHIPVVGDSRELDIERIITLNPDLFVVWKQGNSVKQINQLRKLGRPIFFIDAHKLVDIPKEMQALGKLLGTEQQANKSAAEFRDKLAGLSKRYANLSPVRLFYQVWENPLYTLSEKQIVSDAIRLCGGVNVFSSQKLAAPGVSAEAVLQKNPEAILGSSGVGMWKHYPRMVAVKQNNLFELDGALIDRAGPRMILGVAQLCEKLDLARQHRR